MPRPGQFAPRFILPFLLVGLLLSCSEQISDLPDSIWTPEHLQATVNDTLLFMAIFDGDPTNVARFSWDFNSDGIFDYIHTNFGYGDDTLIVDHHYGQVGDYAATLQLTTVDNHLYRRTTAVTITDLWPTIAVDFQASAGCGETMLLTGQAADDAGFRAWWDLHGDGVPEAETAFSDSATVSLEVSFQEPGHWRALFNARDNDNHTSSVDTFLVVGHEPEWEEISPMAQPRVHHCATSWDDKVFVFGGRHLRTPLSSVEVFDPADSTWHVRAEMPTARWGAQAVEVDGLIYVIGGILDGGGCFNTLEVYDPAGDSWTTYDPSDSTKIMPLSKTGFSAVQVGHTAAAGDSILLFGGFADWAPNDTSLIFDTNTLAWSRDQTHFMRETRAWMGAGVSWNEGSSTSGIFLAAGGTTDGSMLSNVFESYDPGTDYWNRQIVLPQARFLPTMAIHDRKAYLMGGGNESAWTCDQLDVFSLSSETWHEAAALPQALAGAAAVTIDEKIMLIGGGIDPDLMFQVDGTSAAYILHPWRCAP